MKYLFIVGALFLSGCAVITPRTFNPVEYDYSVKTTVSATRAVHLCGNAEYQTKFASFVNDLNEHSMSLMEYEKHIDGNQYSLVGATYVRQLVIDFTVRQNKSNAYCVHKLSSIQSASRTLSRALGGLNAYDICDSDVMQRYSKYEESFKAGKLSKDEFVELVNDLKYLKTVDRASCSFDNKEKLDQAIDFLSKVLPAVL